MKLVRKAKQRRLMIKRSDFLALCSKRILFLDGAYGTEFFSRGFQGPVELLNIEKPELVRDLHRAYADAGADIILTNTFSANRTKLASLGFEDNFELINRRGVEIARDACGDRIVCGDISSTGTLIQPLGEMPFEKACEIFEEQASVLVDSGVDCILIETMSDIKETKAAILGVREASDKIPLIAHMTFEKNGKSVTGTSVEIFATLMNDLDIDVAGINCTLEPKEMLPVFGELAKYCRKPLCVEPNAGMPALENEKLSYHVLPEEFALYAADFVELGANIVGGCCGTTPEHIRAMTRFLRRQKPRKRDPLKTQYLSSRTSLKLTEPFFVIGERINASGRKKLQREIQQNDFSSVIALADEQEAEGCSALDVNLGIEKLLSKEHFKELVLELDRHSSLPLSFDIQSAEFLEIAMKEYPGRGVINSAFSRKDHLEERIALLKKYGGMLIVLAMEEEIPQSAEERFEVVMKAAAMIQENNFDLERVYFDPLVLPVGAKNDYHTTIETIRLIKGIGLKTSIGLSNLSFGMPDREYINAAFLALCIEAGLDAVIMNTKEKTVMNVLAGALALQNRSLVKSEAPVRDPLIDAIIRGRKEAVMKLIREKLKEENPLYVSQEVLGKAMEEIGKLYANGSIYLPHLVMAAETVQPVFDYLNALFEGGTKKLGKIVFATVYGDVHDIGKKIVASLLRSSGFEVYDIGKNVPASKIIEECIAHKPDILALSAMMTTTVGQVKEIADLLKAKKISIPIIAGGASMNEQLAERFGVKYAKDAIQALELCKEIIYKK